MLYYYYSEKKVFSFSAHVNTVLYRHLLHFLAYSVKDFKKSNLWKIEYNTAFN